jgi:hypothetical protein
MLSLLLQVKQRAGIENAFSTMAHNGTTDPIAGREYAGDRSSGEILGCRAAVKKEVQTLLDLGHQRVGEISLASRPNVGQGLSGKTPAQEIQADQPAAD